MVIISLRYQGSLYNPYHNQNNRYWFISFKRHQFHIMTYFLLLVDFQFTSLLAEIDLNIQEAHAFSTNDGYSLDVFVVEGWLYEVVSSYVLDQLRK